MTRSKKMHPINRIVYVHSSECSIISPEDITINLVGEKAYGLASLPSSWTLPFFVISSSLFDDYNLSHKSLSVILKWKECLQEAAKRCGFSDDETIIVRSSSPSEGLSERGMYSSFDGCLSEIGELIKKCFDSCLKKSNSKQLRMPLVVQKKITSLLRGHVSNERRIAEELRDWSVEIDSGIPNTFNISLRNWRKKINVESYIDNPLVCPDSNLISDVLSIPCTWATANKHRVHFEWIFDGDSIFIVQADEESSCGGHNPKDIMNLHSKSNSENFFVPLCLHILCYEKDHDRYRQFLKIQNPLLYQKIGQKTAPIYILDDNTTLTKLSEGIITTELEHDLKELVEHSLIIRTDIDTEDKEIRQLLPRTCEIRNVESAKKWLVDNYSELRKTTDKQIIFLMHNFIPAFSSAFAYASPQDSVVKIEALWGLPEGLYYYSHDKCIVDTISADLLKAIPELFKISYKKNYKNYFVSTLRSGDWEVQTLSPPFDWQEAIPNNEWIKTIALVSRKIAEEENKSVSVMWFVGVDYNKYNCYVFPWVHEPFDFTETSNTPRNKLSFEKSYTIHTLQDITLLSLPSNNSEIIKNIFIHPTDIAILRDKTIIETIGRIAQSFGANIILEGGILSHAYYQLVRTGAKVEIRNPFGRVQITEHNKLVRDSIPQKIKSNGEEAVTALIDQKVFFTLLKRKLVEEALEVLDSNNDDELYSELADVLEVIDGIVKQHSLDYSEIVKRKDLKRTTVGGFDEGVYLRKTSSSSISSNGKIVHDERAVDASQRISKSTDLRKHSNSNESYTRIKVPSTLTKWEVHPSVNAENIDIIMKGERKKSTWYIEVSVYEEAEQMSLFD